MNTWQKIVLLLFSIFLLIASIASFSDDKPTPGILALGLSAIGLFFFFSGVNISIKSEVKTKIKKILKIIGLIVTTLLIVGITIQFISFNIDKAKFKKALKYIEVVNHSVTKIPVRYSAYSHSLEVTICNKGDFVIEEINGAIEYYTTDGYFIKRDHIFDLSSGAVITPHFEATMSKPVNLYEPIQAYKTKFVIENIQIR